MVLDLIIRGKTNGRASLDDVMRRMYEEFYLKSPQRQLLPARTWLHR